MPGLITQYDMQLRIKELLIMRTDKKKVNLADTSTKYIAQQQKHVQNNKQVFVDNQTPMTKKQQKEYKKNAGLHSSPILGTLIGVFGTFGAISSAISGLTIVITLIIGFAGGIGALMCKGPYDYTSLSAKFCAGASVISLITTTIIFAIYLKSIGILDFIFSINI